ncbi:hypothetical protein ABTL21_19750, partial [Acinetobacter baumannii]
NSWYVEISRTGKLAEQQFEALALPFAAEYQIPLVATQDVRFLTPEDFEAHEARVAIHAGEVLSNPARAKNYTEKQYLTSCTDM